MRDSGAVMSQALGWGSLEFQGLARALHRRGEGHLCRGWAQAAIAELPPTRELPPGPGLEVQEVAVIQLGARLVDQTVRALSR